MSAPHTDRPENGGDDTRHDEGRHDCLIVTAASAAFGPSLLALLGSIAVNWPTHPPMLVYDIGLDDQTRAALAAHHVAVRVVPPFCPHWRDHFTWKIWCLNDAPARRVIWMDAGIAVLQPLDEIVSALRTQGYFFVPNHHLLDWEASEQTCAGCGVPPAFREGKATLAGTFMGWDTAGPLAGVLEDALAVAQVEAHIAATDAGHRHDQALLSLLVYKHHGQPLLADSGVYLGALSPQQVHGQKVWVHRRAILPADVKHLAARISTGGRPHALTPPYSLRQATSRSHLFKVRWSFGRGDLAGARDSLAFALALEPAIVADRVALARRLTSDTERLQRLGRDTVDGVPYAAWVIDQLIALTGDASFARERERATAPAGGRRGG